LCNGLEVQLRVNNVKLFLYTKWNHEDRAELLVDSFLNQTLDAVKWLASPQQIHCWESLNTRLGAPRNRVGCFEK